MKKMKLLIKNYGALILGVLAFIGSILASFMVGNRKREKELKKEKISVVKKEAENVILKEKITDKEKTLNEISEDVDNILDRK